MKEEVRIICKNVKCGKEFMGEKDRKFCSRSCSISHNNLGVRRNGQEPPNCKNCGARLSESSQKYCSIKCQAELRRLESNDRVVGGLRASSRLIKRYLIESQGHVCSICKLTEWYGAPIPLVMDHIDGHSENNNLDNLRLVCGNCDMQLPTYKSKNKGNGRHSRKQRYSEGKSY